jgi:tetratricopeptide (TPR) repeat protein/serine phosphatase RsbU (regulator of sigma subunit)
MRLGLLFVFLLAVLPAFSQSHAEDSLRNEIRTTKNDTNRIDALRHLSMAKWNTDADTSILLLNQAIDQANKLKEPDRTYWLGIVNEDLGNYHVYFGDAVKALGHFTISIACWDSLLAHADKNKIANYNHHKTVATGNLGQAYEMKGDYPKALDCYFLALTMWEKAGNKRAVASKCSTIAIVYDAQSDTVKALEYYTKALTLFTEVKDSTNIAKMYSNIGTLYFNEKNYAKALENDSLALFMHTQKNNRRSVAVVLSNIGLVYQAQGDFVTALDCYNRALAIDREVGNTRGEMIRLSNMGVVYTLLKRFREAETCLLRALKMSDSLNNVAIAQDVHKDLSDLYKATGRYELALKEYEIYSGIKDSLFNLERGRDLARKEASYEFDKITDSTRVAQEKKDIAEAAAQQIADETLKRTRLILFAFAGGFLLLGVLAFFIFRSYKEKQKANVEISRQKSIIEEKNKDMRDSIVYAQRIQNALFASDELLGKHLAEYFILFKPKDIVSGDFYYATVKGQSFYLAACDSTGHGVPGAFMSLLNIAYLNEAVNEQKLTSTDKIFNHVRARLIENISAGGQQDGMDGILVRFNLWAAQNDIEYSAAYNAPFVVREGKGESLHADKMPVGKGDKTEDFTLSKAELPKGSCLYLFTDGFADQFGGEKGKKMKRKVLEEKLVFISNETMEKQKEILEAYFSAWKAEHEQVDDILIIGIRM